MAHAEIANAISGKEFPERVYILINRAPFKIEETEKTCTLTKNSSWSSLFTAQEGVHIIAVVDEKLRAHDDQIKKHRLLPIYADTEGDLYSRYYFGQSNARGWPLLHGPKSDSGFSPKKFDEKTWFAYVEMNKQFANKIKEEAKTWQKDDPAPIIWVQDYQLMLTPGLLKNTPAKVGYFHHVPWCSWDYFKKHICIAEGDAILSSLCSAQHLGFHTDQWKNNFLSCVKGALADPDENHYVALKKLVKSVKGEIIKRYDGTEVTPKAIPLGIDFEERSSIAERLETVVNTVPALKDFVVFQTTQTELLKKKWQKLEKTIEEKANDPKNKPADFYKDLLEKINEKENSKDFSRLCILSVDRMDLTKGFDQRLSAINAFFDLVPEARELVTFVMINSTTRDKIPEYKALQNEITGGKNNPNKEDGKLWKLREKYGQETIYTLPPMPSDALQALHHLCDTMLVTSTVDGLHLGAAEMIAAHANKQETAILINNKKHIIKDKGLSVIMSEGAGASAVFKKELDNEAAIIKAEDVMHYPGQNVEKLTLALCQTLVCPVEKAKKTRQRLAQFVETRCLLKNWVTENLAKIRAGDDNKKIHASVADHPYTFSFGQAVNIDNCKTNHSLSS
jgi:trehalose 6-phosphate synthase/phosphatase